MAFDPANPFGSPQGTDPYNALRNRAAAGAQAAGASNIDAIQRRYAAMGNLNSGSAVKAMQDQGRQTQAQTQDAVGNIDVAEQGQSQPYALQKAQLGQQESQFEKELPFKQRSLDLEANQQRMDEEANRINQGFGQWQEQHSGGLLGAGGFLGSGLNL